MANQLQSSVTIRLSGESTATNSRRTFEYGTVESTHTNSSLGGYEQQISSDAYSTIDFGELSYPYEIGLRNCSDEFYIDYGPSDGDTSPSMIPFGRIEPLGQHKFGLAPGVVMLAICEADGSSVGMAKLDVFAVGEIA